MPVELTHVPVSCHLRPADAATFNFDQHAATQTLALLEHAGFGRSTRRFHREFLASACGDAGFLDQFRRNDRIDGKRTTGRTFAFARAT